MHDLQIRYARKSCTKHDWILSTISNPGWNLDFPDIYRVKFKYSIIFLGKQFSNKKSSLEILKSNKIYKISKPFHPAKYWLSQYIDSNDIGPNLSCIDNTV